MGKLVGQPNWDLVCINKMLECMGEHYGHGSKGLKKSVVAYNAWATETGRFVRTEKAFRMVRRMYLAPVDVFSCAAVLATCIRDGLIVVLD
jgi:hypothetical protein